MTIPADPPDRSPPPDAPRRTRRPTRELTDLLLDAAAEEFKRCGYAGATTAAIARRAHTTEAQLFRYFGSKADLFRESVFKQLDRHFATFNARHPADEAGIADVRALSRLYITELQRFLGEQADLLMTLFVAQTYRADAGPGMGDIASLRAYFERGAAVVARTGAGAALRIDPRLLVRISFAAVLANVLFKGWLFPPDLASETEIEDAVIDFVIDGISADLG